MAQQEQLNEFINSLADEINGFIGASVVDLGTGMSLASISRVANFDLDVAAAYNSEMVKAKYNTIRALGIDTELQDMLLTLSDQLHLIRVLGNELFVYVAVNSAQSNLAILRSVVNKNVAKYNLAWMTSDEIASIAGRRLAVKQNVEPGGNVAGLQVLG